MVDRELLKLKNDGGGEGEIFQMKLVTTRREREEHDRGKPSEQTNIYFRFAGCRFNKFN